MSWDGSASNYTDEQYKDAAVLDRGGDAPVKQRFGLPIKTPEGQLHPDGVHAAAQRISQVSGASPEQKQAAAKKLIAAHNELDLDVPDSLKEMASEQRSTEQRTATVDVADVHTEGRTLYGYAALYGVESRDLGGFRERIEPGAFREVLAADPDTYLTLNHSQDKVLARTHSGTLRLRDEARGLAFEADLGDGPTAQDVRDQVRRGDVTGASFRFKVAPNGERWEGERRSLTRIGSLIDISLATVPAYDGPRVELRSAPEDNQSEEAVVPEENQGGGGLTVNRNAPESRSGSSGDVETRVLEAIKAIRPGESRSLTTTSASSIDVPELATFVWDKLYPESVMLSAGIKVISTSRESLLFPLVTTAVDPTWTAEATEIPEGDPGWTQLSVTPSKLGHRVVISNEALDDAPIDLMGWVQSHVMKMMGLKLDAGLLEGHPAAGAPGATGLKYTAGIQNIDVLGTNGGTLDSLDPIAEAISALEQANARPSALVMAPEVWFAAETLKDANRRYLLSPSQDPTQAPSRSLFGVPVYTSSQLSTNEPKGTATNTTSIYCFDSTQVVLVRRLDATLEVDRAQFFSSDMSQLRAKLRCQLCIPSPQAVARVPGIIVGS